MKDKMLDEVMIALDAVNGEREWPQFCTPIQANIQRIAKRATSAEARAAQLEAENAELKQEARDLASLATQLRHERDEAIKANEKLASEALSLKGRKFSDRNNAALLSRAEAAERKLEQARHALITGHDLAAVADALGVKVEAQS